MLLHTGWQHPLTGGYHIVLKVENTGFIATEDIYCYNNLSDRIQEMCFT